MNRKEEYQALLTELSNTPPALSYTVQRAQARERRLRRRKTLFGISLASVAGCITAFVLLVNLLPSFAYACGQIPFLRELALAVAWSPSLSAAVENEYVQPINRTQEENGIATTVEYVIVDRKQVHIFYTLDYDPEAVKGQVYTRLSYKNIQGWSGTASSADLSPGELAEASLDFVDGTVPDTLDMTIRVYTIPTDEDRIAEDFDYEESLFERPMEETQSYLAEPSFQLTFDPYYTAQGEVIPVNTTFQLDGQTFTLTEAELYPTHLRIQLDDAPDNTAWLKGLSMYLENERGDRFERTINGITATGDPDGKGLATFWLDSPFFSQGEHLTLHITQAQWRQKDGPLVRINLPEQTAEHLPDGVRLLKAKQKSGGWLLSFVLPREPDGPMYNLFSGSFRDKSGTEHEIWASTSSYGYWDPTTGTTVHEEDMFTEEIPLADVQGDVVYLEPSFDKTTKFSTPAAIPIR